MTDLEQLALRCEQAEGPDKFLGREVLLACGKGYVSPLYRWLDPTASIDATLTLVPEGEERWPQVEYLGPNPNNARTGHRVWLWLRSGKVRGEHPTSFALALCAAALRARSA